MHGEWPGESFEMVLFVSSVCKFLPWSMFPFKEWKYNSCKFDARAQKLKGLLRIESICSQKKSRIKEYLLTQPQTQPNIIKVGFDTKMTLHHQHWEILAVPDPILSEL